MVYFFKLAAAFSLISAGFAHPGHEEEELAAALSKREYVTHAARNMAACAEHLERRGHNAQAQARRHELVMKERRAAIASKGPASSIENRDTGEILGKSHHSNLTGITETTDPATVFSSNKTCILQPEGDVGPYWVSGELIRTDVRESETGVSVILSARFIDISTCLPIPELYWDVWNCNATGVYGGVVANGNGNSADASNINNTALRGLVPSDEDGIATLYTIFPGHYTGRTIHFHVIAHLNATVLANGTLSGGTVPHVGQLFFDQDLITAVELTAPYNTNTQSLTLNTQDGILAGMTATESDPLLEYVLLGDTVEDGLFAWVDIGVDASAAYTPRAAVNLTETGGVANPGGGGGPGGPPPSGTFTGGPPPTASATTVV